MKPILSCSLVDGEEVQFDRSLEDIGFPEAAEEKFSCERRTRSSGTEVVSKIKLSC